MEWRWRGAGLSCAQRVLAVVMARRRAATTVAGSPNGLEIGIVGGAPALAPESSLKRGPAPSGLVFVRIRLEAGGVPGTRHIQHIAGSGRPAHLADVAFLVFAITLEKPGDHGVSRGSSAPGAEVFRGGPRWLLLAGLRQQRCVEPSGRRDDHGQLALVRDDEGA